MTYGFVGEYIKGIKKDWVAGKRFDPIVSVIITAVVMITFLIGTVNGVLQLINFFHPSNTSQLVISSTTSQINFGTSSLQQAVSNNNGPTTMVGRVDGDYVAGDKQVTNNIGDLPRSIEVQKQESLISSLSKSTSTVGFVVKMFDQEAKNYAKQLSKLFAEAGWNVHELNITGAGGVGDGLVLGLYATTDEYKEVLSKAGQLVLDSFNKAGIKIGTNPPEQGSYAGQMFDNTVYIFVGSKP